MPTDDEDIFASAISDEPVTAPAEPAPAPVEPAPSEPSEQPRDPHGRYASTPPAEPEPAAHAPQEHGVPPGRLREVNEARRAAEQRAADLERRLAEVEARTRAPAPPTQPPAPKPEIWDNPDAFVESALDPIKQQVTSRFERMSQRMAVKEYGEDTVKGAFQALDAAVRARDPAAVAFHAQVLESDHPYADIVEWNKRTQAVARVGNDPEAWLERELEERISKDPAFQAKMLERIRGQAASAASAARSSSPAVSMPPSLTRAAASAPVTGDDDVSDAGLFRYATG